MYLPRQLLRIIGLLLCTLALAGCGSLTRITYNQADDLLYWWLDSYVDFQPEQSPRMRDDLAALLQWHRSTQLPQYADLLRRIQPLALQDITPAQACDVATEGRRLLEATLPQTEPTLAWLAAGLGPTQLDHLQRKYDKTNEEFDREWRKPPAEEVRKARIRQARSRSEMLYGKLEREQMAVLSATVDDSRWDAAAARTERLRRQQDTLQTLRRIQTDKPAPAELRSQMRGLLERSLVSPNPEYRARQEALFREACTSFARVHNSTTPAQRAKALETLKGYEADFRGLAVRR